LEKTKLQVERIKEIKNKLESENFELNEKNIKLNRKLEEKVNKFESEVLNYDTNKTKLHKEISELKDKLIKLTEYKKDKVYLNQQVELLHKELDDSKKIQEGLLNAMQRSTLEPRINEILDSNKNLANILGRMENRCCQLESKVKDLKVFQSLVKNSLSIQCLHCKKQI